MNYMTKLEEKLIELGYKKVFYDIYEKIMSFDKEVKICIRLDNFNEKIKESIIAGYRFITKKEQLNTMYNAFEQLEKDLKELNKCQD